MVESNENASSTSTATATATGAKSRYSSGYRVAKTLLLILGWVTYGMNNEIVGPTFEDLRLLLGLNYGQISLTLVVRALGKLLFIPLGGLILDKWTQNNANLVMVVSGMLVAAPNFVIASKYANAHYLLTVAYFFIQGIATAFFDVGANRMILDLWTGISTAPINAVHGGFGLGALLVVQLVKPFVAFRSDLVAVETISPSNQTTPAVHAAAAKSLETAIYVPYTISALIGVVISLLFVFAHRIEARHAAHAASVESPGNQHDASNKLPLLQTSNDQPQTTTKSKKPSLLVTLFFGNKDEALLTRTSCVAYMFVQMVLLIALLFFIQGSSVLVAKFLLTFVTLGPAKLSVADYFQFQTLFWLMYVVVRFASAFIAFRLDATLYMAIFLSMNALVASLFMVPYFATSATFYWIASPLLGLLMGPTCPTTFMLANTVLGEFNSFVLSLMISGDAIGSMVFQQLPGELLDMLEPRPNGFLGFDSFTAPYIIGHLIFGAALLSFLSFFTIVFLHKYFSPLRRTASPPDHTTIRT